MLWRLGLEVIQRWERIMIRWMCGVTLRDKESIEEL